MNSTAFFSQKAKKSKKKFFSGENPEFLKNLNFFYFPDFLPEKLSNEGSKFMTKSVSDPQILPTVSSYYSPVPSDGATMAP